MKWKTEKLLDICSVRTGKRDANHNTLEGKYPFFTCADKPIKCPTYSFEGPSIILPGNGANVGLVLAYNGKFEAYQRTYVLNNFKADYRYVFHHLNRYWKIKNSNTQYGSATNYIRMQNFEDYEIPVPPLPEQKRIADILDKADSLRKKRQQAIEQCDEFLKSTFLHMFGDPVTNPKSWNPQTIDSFTTKVGSGSTPRGGQSVYQKKGIKFIRSQNVLMNFVDYSNIYCISEIIHNKMKGTWVKNGDVLLNITGASIGRIASFKGEDNSANVNQHVCIIRADKKQMNPIFLSYTMSYPSYQAKIIASNAGGTRQAFNFQQIKGFIIPVPPLSLQKKFASIVEKTEAVKQKMQQQLKELDDNFNSLMQRAFKGEL